MYVYFHFSLNTEVSRIVVWKSKKGKIEGRNEDKSMDRNEDLEYETVRIVE